MKIFRLSLTVTILAALASLLILTWLLLSIIAFTTAEKDLYTMKGEAGKALLAMVLRAVPAPLTTSGRNQSMSPDLVGSLADVEGFNGFVLVDQNGCTVYSLADRRGSDPRLRQTLRDGSDATVVARGGTEILCYAPMNFQGKRVGAARLALTLSSEHERLARSRRLFHAYFAIDFLMLLGLGYLSLRRIVVAPMRRLLSATQRIAAGDYGSQVHVPGSTEIAELADSFNAMLESLRTKRDEVDRHVCSLEEVNRQLQAAREETLRSERLASVGLLAAGTAHEIGTPLAAIIGYAGILREELAGDREKLDYAVRIEQDAGRIDRIVRDLLHYAKPAHGERLHVQVAGLLDETVALLTGQGAFKSITTTVIAAAGLPELYLDRFQLQQVLINLLINARDAMPHGGLIEVRANCAEMNIQRMSEAYSGVIRGRRRDDFGGIFSRSLPGDDASLPCIRIDIRDAGEGIFAENLDRIFDPFFTTKEPGKGTGLGLSIAARIIDSFGGRITVNSTVGEGSCFTVWLPVVDDDQDQR
ncbi:MAG: HAMP domain-containing protein [Geobacter sp.]|nr:HAMP domain-containing protein [Geobacter sp.]